MNKIITTILLLMLWTAPVWALPATIGDNSTNTFSGTDDVAMRSLNPTTALGTVTSLDFAKYAVGDHNHVLVRFSGLSNITGPVTVTGATLYLYGLGGNGTEAVDARQVLRTWSEAQATWNVYTTGNGWTTPGALGAATDRSATVVATGSATTGLGYIAITGAGLPALVEGWINGTIPNEGLHLERNGTGNDTFYKVFGSSEGTNGRRPYLDITYTSAAPDANAPTAPSGLIATVLGSNTAIDLNWTPSTDVETTPTYRIESCTTAACVNFAQIGTSTTAIFHVTGLTVGTLYRFRVIAYDGTNLSSYSSIVQATTLAVEQSTLTWADLINTDHIGYTLQRKIGTGGTYADLATVGPTIRTYIDSSSPLLACYRLFAFRASENGPQSSEACKSAPAPSVGVTRLNGKGSALGKVTIH